ncbi:hypothetical protein ZWY2020_041792 [Hordeum vulgare]|nr:hypothetical protein ZWY2020_041792 [Hordeum vulgare]
MPEPTKPLSPRPSRGLCCLGSALLAIVISTLVHLLSPPPQPAPSPRFSVIIDAGSTGTRAHVFSLGPDGRPDLARSAVMRVSPGLSSSPMDTALESLRPLMEFAKEKVGGEGAAAATEVRLMATVGLRLLEESVREAILVSCRNALRASGFRFEDSWAKVADEIYSELKSMAHIGQGEDEVVVPTRGRSALLTHSRGLPCLLLAVGAAHLVLMSPKRLIHTNKSWTVGGNYGAEGVQAQESMNAPPEVSVVEENLAAEGHKIAAATSYPPSHPSSAPPLVAPFLRCSTPPPSPPSTPPPPRCAAFFLLLRRDAGGNARCRDAVRCEGGGAASVTEATAAEGCGSGGPADRRISTVPNPTGSRLLAMAKPSPPPPTPPPHPPRQGPHGHFHSSAHAPSHHADDAIIGVFRTALSRNEAPEAFALQAVQEAIKPQKQTVLVLENQTLENALQRLLWELVEEFEEYAEKAKTLPDTTTNESKLCLYSLYKQATVGPVNTGLVYC